jgi:hypothetical protein
VGQLGQLLGERQGHPSLGIPLETEQHGGALPAGLGSPHPSISDVSTVESIQARWRKQEAAELGGWFFAACADGWGPDGEPMQWDVYRHEDGREVSALADGRCTDPELAALLAASGSPSRQTGPLASAVFALARRKSVGLRR